MEVARRNALDAMPGGPFVAAIGRAVCNEGTPREGAAWLLDLGTSFLRSEGVEDAGPWQSFDLLIVDFEQLDRIWPAFILAAQNLPAGAPPVLPGLARFMAERLPNVWRGDHLRPVAPVTRAVALADRIDTLVGLFFAGAKVTGSKDPFALRRAAREVLEMIVFPICRLQRAA